MISLLAIPVITPVLIACCVVPEKVLSSGMINSRCQLDCTDGWFGTDSLDKGSFVTGSTDVLPSKDDVNNELLVSTGKVGDNGFYKI